MSKTRKDQISEAAYEFALKTHPDVLHELVASIFRVGSEWADANPHESITELIHQRSIAFDDALDARTKLAIAVEALEHYEKIEDFRVSAKAFLALKKIKDMK
jgi:hypothetical protein